MTEDLAEWLLEQIADDEAAAQRCPGTDFVMVEHPSRPGLFEAEAYAPGSLDRFDDLVVADGGARGIPEPYAQHVERWDPTRVLAECDAKRRIIEIHKQAFVLCGFDEEAYPCVHLRLLALPYANRPGYRAEWSVT